MSVGGQRIDKWLWHARFARTRTLAQKLVVAGNVRINRQKLDTSSTQVRVGDVLTVVLGDSIRVIRVAAFAERRGAPAQATHLYEDLTPPAPPAPTSAGPRPTKRDRRALDDFRRSDDDGD